MMIVFIFSLAASIAESVIRSGIRSSVRLSVSPVGILTVTHQGAAWDAASVHFRPDNKEDRRICSPCNGSTMIRI